MLGRPSVDQTEYFPTGAPHGKIQKELKKLRNPEPLALEKLLHAMLH
jgi:hypothetical protein